MLRKNLDIHSTFPKFGYLIKIQSCYYNFSKKKTESTHNTAFGFLLNSSFWYEKKNMNTNQINWRWSFGRVGYMWECVTVAWSHAHSPMPFRGIKAITIFEFRRWSFLAQIIIILLLSLKCVALAISRIRIVYSYKNAASLII